MQPSLTDVPETTLWTLYNRASEVSRSDGVLEDPDAVRIYEAIDYDYVRSFGVAESSSAVRSAMFDDAIRRFLTAHPDGVVVNLGEGLETQRFRLDDLDTAWFSVDLPEAIAVRERFIEPDGLHRHVACSVLDRAWFDEVPVGRPTILTAQGLFMYLEEEDLRELFAHIARRFPDGVLVFDTIPRWLSRKTLSADGWQKTPHYTTPTMPWGIDRHELEPTLRRWVPSLREVTIEPWWRFPRGFVQRWLFPVVTRTPLLGRYTPSVVHVQFGGER